MVSAGVRGYGAPRRARVVAAAGPGQARRRVPEDLQRAVQRHRQLQEHAGAPEGLQGRLRLRTQAALGLLQQLAGIGKFTVKFYKYKL